jgi:predicted RNA-binding Zn-ribbon protein involved in translation (DUF1610 family)
MEERSKHTYETLLYQFAKDILVVCPQCSEQAIVRTGDFEALKKSQYDIKVVCTSCGYNKTLEKVSPRKEPKQKRGNVLIFGAPIDPFFHLPVWLQADFSGQTLWAYNHEHLEFLAEHVGAKLRERNTSPRMSRSIGARLPRWMTTAGNREAVLKAIEKLKGK